MKLHLLMAALKLVSVVWGSLSGDDSQCDERSRRRKDCELMSEALSSLQLICDLSVTLSKSTQVIITQNYRTIDRNGLRKKNTSNTTATRPASPGHSMNITKPLHWNHLYVYNMLIAFIRITTRNSIPFRSSRRFMRMLLKQRLFAFGRTQ